LGASSYFDSFLKKRKDFKGILDEVLRVLNEQQVQIRMRIASLQRRENELLRICVMLIRRRDRVRARIYAYEVVEIHRVLSVLQKSELVVEALRLRVDTAKELGDAVGTLRPLADALSRVRMQLQGFVPEVARSMAQTAEALNDVLSMSVPEGGIGEFSSPLNAESVESILKDAEELASRKLREELEKVDEAELKPFIDYIKSNGIESIQSIVDNFVDKFGANGIDTLVEEGVSSQYDGGLLYVRFNESESDVPRRVYEYIKSRNGVLELSSCCRDLGVSRDTVISALHTLEAQGKIKLDHQPA
jgi:division protein CdvB (Snf7/Vps24/ESCRT-III family)